MTTTSSIAPAVKLCQVCREWVGPRNGNLCVDCERKSKIKPRMPCNFPDCKLTYAAIGASLYCIEHKGMTSKERLDAMRALGVEPLKKPAPLRRLIRIAYEKKVPADALDNALSLLTAAAAFGNYNLMLEENPEVARDIKALLVGIDHLVVRRDK